MSELNASDEERLVQLMAKCRHDPLGFVKIAYPWGQDDLKDSKGPRVWQAEVLNEIGQHFKNPATRFMPLMMAVASGHGPGKSALVSMVVDWAMSTCADTKIVVSASTDTQLKTKTFPEIISWIRRSLNAHWFTTTATSISSRDPDHVRTWRTDAIPWSAENTEAFAGLHNKGRRIVLIFDEASSIDDRIWEVAEGALTDENTEIIWLAFGNPTRNTGRFRECFGRFKHRWKTRQIDSRSVEGTNKEQLESYVRDYGEDSDFVRVRVKGEFPRAGTMQFIPGDIVEEARRREPVASSMDSVVMGVDVARFGDDQSCIVIRRGRDAVSIPWVKLRGVDTMTLAARVVELANQYNPDVIFVDEGGVGGGVVDRLRMLKKDVIGIQFGAASDRSQETGEGAVVYKNKRAEMWGYMREWLKGGSIPNDPDLAAELTSVEYGYSLHKGRDAIQLEKKEDMRKRGLSSPDQGDALCFVANTMIRTSRGQKPIQELRIGDVVCTPFGNTKIVKFWESETTRLTTVCFNNGSVLSGKGEHKIFVWGEGAKRLDALTFTDVVSSHNEEIMLWAILRKFFIRASGIEFKPLVDTICRTTKTTRSAFFIAAFGLIITGRFQKITTSTIATKIGETMTSLIWKLYPNLCIEGIILQKQLKLACSNHQQLMLSKRRQNGTLRAKVVNGTENTLTVCGLKLQQKLKSAKHVAKSIKRTWAILNFVRVLALKELVIGAILPLRAHVRGVVKSLKLIDTGIQTVVQGFVRTEKEDVKKKNSAPRKSVYTAIRYFNRLLSALVKRTVPVAARSEVVLPVKVYNITLEKHNAYYANDILVYNCLTFAYVVMPSVHQPPHKNQNTHQSDYKAITRNKARGR